MHILENVDLRLYSTMRLGGRASWLAEAYTPDDVKDLVEWAKHKQVPFITVGQGSNIVWRDDGFKGLILANKLKGIEVVAEDDESLTLRIGAGEIWDEAVAWSVNRNLTGIEFLSRIPGLAGAAPVQNIGAYGAELADVLLEVEAYDAKEDVFECLIASSCSFAYRTSRFKNRDHGRFVILNILVRLKKQAPQPPFYESLQNHLTTHGITEYTPKTIREAVTEIRNIKLPDPSVVASNGSFFINPVVDMAKLEELKSRYPDIKAWPREDGRAKLAAGWMVEKAGFKDFHNKNTGVGTWQHSALVLINEKAKSTKDLLDLQQTILEKVEQLFGVNLEQEPELLP